ncbi:MAG: hypothetical protein PHV35_03460 [Mariniphaga sp.]|nr:hypothetical protein [Mariniphaga sp.]
MTIPSVKSIVTLFLLTYTLTLSAAYLKNIPRDLKQPQATEKENSLEHELNYVTLNWVIKSAMEVVNHFDDYRELPDTLHIETEKYATHQLFNVFIDAIISISNGGDTIFYPNQTIEPPSDLYVAINIDSSVYEKPLEKSEYIDLCTHIQKKIPELDKIPDLIEFRGSNLRTVEAIYLFAFVIRYYHFFGELPNIVQLIITPRGLVPWDLPDSLKIYT